MDRPAGCDQWLSGPLFYSHPPVWSCRVTPHKVEIVAGGKTLAAGALMGVLIAVLIGVVVVADTTRDGGDAVVLSCVMLAGVIPFAAVMGCAAFITMRERRRGGYMVYSASARTVTLRRHGRVFPRADVLCWRVVSGNWSGRDGDRKRHDEAMSELHLVVRTADGPVAYPVVGWCSVSMAEGVRQVAEATGIPLEVVDQAEGVERFEPKPRMDW